MSDSIRVTLARDTDGGALTAYLAEHGFVVHRVGAADETVLDVGRPTNPSERLDADVWDAMTTWLDESRRPLVPITLAEHEYALTPPGE